MSAEDIHWSADDCPWFKRRCQEIDARIRDDIQVLLIAAGDMFEGWAKDGLLDLTWDEYRWSDETRQTERRKVLHSKEHAVRKHLELLRDMLMDARSLTAIEAEEVARGDDQ